MLYVYKTLWYAAMPGALMLCINFVSLFLSLLNLTGERRE